MYRADDKMLTATIVGIMLQMLIDQGLTDTAIANMFTRKKVREVLKVVRAKKKDSNNAQSNK